MRLASLLLTALSITAAATTTSAQALHGQWFKVVASADGYGYDPETESTGKSKAAPITRYLFFVAGEGSAIIYDAQSYVPTISGGWVPSYVSTFVMDSAEEDFIRYGTLVLDREPVASEVELGAANILILQFNARVKTKYKGEQLKSSQIKSLGAVAEFADATPLFTNGRGKCSMTRIDADELPFDPPALSAVKASIAKAPVVPRPDAQAEQATAPRAGPASTPTAPAVAAPQPAR